MSSLNRSDRSVEGFFRSFRGQVVRTNAGIIAEAARMWERSDGITELLAQFEDRCLGGAVPAGRAAAWRVDLSRPAAGGEVAFDAEGGDDHGDAEEDEDGNEPWYIHTAKLVQKVSICSRMIKVAW